MVIQVLETPNINTLKFVIGNICARDVTVEFASKTDANGCSMVSRLFDINGVKGIFYDSGFISITKDPNIGWEQLKPQILLIIDEDLPSFQNLLSCIGQKTGIDINSVVYDARDRHIVKEIINKLEEFVIPRLNDDGGSVKFFKYENGLVYLSLQGACASCPSAAETLKYGIKALLNAYIKEVQDIVRVDSSGAPIYEEEF